MAAATAKVDCPANAWTKIADNVSDAIVQVFDASGALAAFRVNVATADPSDLAVGIVVAPAAGNIALNGMPAATHVYVCPLRGAGEAQVITW